MSGDECDVIKLKEIFFPDDEQSQSEPVHGCPALSEKVVHEREQYSAWEVATEECHDPVAGEHLQVKAELLKVSMEARDSLSDQLVENVVAQMVLWNTIVVQR